LTRHKPPWYGITQAKNVVASPYRAKDVSRPWAVRIAPSQVGT
jgi:hypothetical protein